MGAHYQHGLHKRVHSRASCRPLRRVQGGSRTAHEGQAVDLAPYMILVKAIAPGPIVTERSAPVFARPDQQQHLKRVLLGHPGMPDDVAAAAAFLASDGGAFIHGAVLTVDGGYLAG
ncbi:MAG: SDR family oxidoreductase [Armatimonadota bacterium]